MGREVENLREQIQAKYLDPLKIRMMPMAITEAAATRSPRNLIFRDNREAESPVRKRAGTVPSPKETMVRNPAKRLWVVAALMTMAQESMQGRKPTAKPKAILEAIRCDRKRGGNNLPKKDPGPNDGREKKEKGRTLSKMRPNRTIKIPPPRVKVLRRPAKN